MSCTHWADGGYCGNQDSRHYLPRERCAPHTPAALAGRPEARVDPALTLDGLRAAHGLVWGFNANDTALYDQRARDSGKRASGAQRKAAHA